MEGFPFIRETPLKLPPPWTPWRSVHWLPLIYNQDIDIWLLSINKNYLIPKILLSDLPDIFVLILCYY